MLQRMRCGGTQSANNVGEKWIADRVSLELKSPVDRKTRRFCGACELKRDDQCPTKAIGVVVEYMGLVRLIHEKPPARRALQRKG